MRSNRLENITWLNPIFIASLIYYRISQYFRRRLISKTLLNFVDAISYPPQINRATDLFDLLFPQLITHRTPYYFKHELRKMGQIELWSVYKFYNLVHHAQASTFCLHEILRRNLKLTSIIGPFGISRYFLSYIFLKMITNNNSMSDAFFRLILRWIYICNKYSFEKHSGDSNIKKYSRVAIVGGAPAPRDNIEEISSFDYVAVLSPRNEFLSRSKVILYIRGEKGDQIFQNKDFDSFSHVKVVFVKLFRHYKVMRSLVGLREKFNSSVFLDYSLDFGKLNAVQSMCFDLVMCEPTEIRVFNTDLNLSKKHREGYRDKALPPVQFNHIFGEHPAAVQFLFLKTLHKYFGIGFEENYYFSIHWSYRGFMSEFYKTYKA